MPQAALIVLVMFLWAICFPLIAMGLSHAPHLTFAAMRALLAGCVLLGLSLMMGRPQPRCARSWFLLTAIGFGATTLGFVGMFHASEYVSPGIATVITNIQPLLAAVFASLFLQERLGLLGVAGLLAGFLGIVLISAPSLLSDPGGDFAQGIAYISLAVLGIAASNVLIRRLAGRLDAMSAMGWQLVIGSLFLAVLAVLTEDVTAVTWNFQFLISLLGLALPGTALAYWLWCRILRDVELNRANAFSFLVPVIGLALGAYFYQERVGVLATVGIVLTISGIVLVNRPRRQTGGHDDT